MFLTNLLGPKEMSPVTESIFGLLWLFAVSLIVATIAPLGDTACLSLGRSGDVETKTNWIAVRS